MKILLINNYSMDNAYSLWEKGLSGSHHVWGKVELEKKENINVEILPHVKFKFLNKIGRFIGITHLDQQIRVLGKTKEFDILYAPYATANTKLLLLLKWLGLFKKPIVVTIHTVFPGSNSKSNLLRYLSKKLILQYEATIFLSEALLDKTKQYLNISNDEISEKIFTAQWGPDSNFYDPFLLKKQSFKDCNYAISAGHTDRDYETLIEAFREIDFPLKIYCTPDSYPKVSNLPSNVQIFSTRIPYFELLDHYQKAIVILVPLKYSLKNEGCQGMTSLQDVVALAKPVIITHNRSLNLDVEKEGIGYHVEMHDINGWRKTFNKLMQDEQRWNLMRENAKKLYLEKFNSTLFTEKLELVFRKVLRRS